MPTSVDEIAGRPGIKPEPPSMLLGMLDYTRHSHEESGYVREHFAR